MLMRVDDLRFLLLFLSAVSLIPVKGNVGERVLVARRAAEFAARGKSWIDVTHESDTRKGHAAMGQRSERMFLRGGSKTASTEAPELKRKKIKEQLPVSLLSGFLGSGKTTLLKHILETKHLEEDFKCAVIVNDMAELNIDKSLIDKSSLIQSDEVIAMQNGCVCCTLKSDLVDQIVELVGMRKFDYMIIEASGVSEPSEIARLFEPCDDDHDHEKHAKTTLQEVARLDTCVTVVDCAEFLNNIETVKGVPQKEGETFAQLMVEQIEFSNVIILNKVDLVDEAQLATIKDESALLNSKAKILTAQNCRVNVMEVVDTGLFTAQDFFNWAPLEMVVDDKEPSCCVQKRSVGESPCCKRARTIDSELSQVLLASKQAGATRHAARFGITSFLYKARRPFHPARFMKKFVDEFFIFLARDDSADEEDPGSSDASVESPEPGDEKHANLVEKYGALKLRYKALEQQLAETQANTSSMVDDGLSSVSNAEHEHQGGEEMGEGEEEEEALEKRQARAKAKQERRIGQLGNLMRCKGFLWIASSHDLMGVLGVAGNVLTLESPGSWSALEKRAWQGTAEEQAQLRRDWEEPWGDRRQELVFIGKDLQHAAVQALLDSCLLSDQEMQLGVDGWKATMGDLHG